MTTKTRRSTRIGSNDVTEITNTNDADLVETSSRRTSARSNKFTNSMKEQSESIQDLIGGWSPRIKSTKIKTKSNERRVSSTRISSAKARQHRKRGIDSYFQDVDNSDNNDDDDNKVSTPPRKRTSSRISALSKSPKSPAVRHSSLRRRVKTENHVSSDEESEVSSEDSESSSEEDEDEDDMKIQRIIACKSETRAVWKGICQKMNTSEVENGSRWFQDDDDTSQDSTKFDERFLVKWSDLSYLHCSWETHDDFMDQLDTAKTHMTNFFRKSENGYLFNTDERLDGEYFDPAFVQVDRILDVTFPENIETSEDQNWGIVCDKDHPDYENGTGRQFLVKWGNTSYSEITYEFERDLILMDVDYVEHLNIFLKRSKKPTKSVMTKCFNTQEKERRHLYKTFGDGVKDDEEKHTNIENYKKCLEEQSFTNGGQLRDYQAEGVSWLLANYVNKRSAILADEMGLGKTIQTAAYVNVVATKMQNRGPFLIVAPLSTIPHWYREFTGWTELNTVIYHGSANDREYIREFEFAFDCDRPRGGLGFNQKYLKKCHSPSARKWEKTWMVEVVITTPEMLVTDDFGELASVSWELLVVDEAHRLKNHSSKLALNLRHESFQFKHMLLLTGTPIQNNMNELWTLLNFIDPTRFEDLEIFMKLYGNMKEKEAVDDLHEAIRPYILRRLKEDVEKSVPPKEETLVEVELTVLQKQYYRALYEKNVQFLHRNVKKALDGPSINNLAMQLRKCCNHPFLLTGVENDVKKSAGDDLSREAEADFLVKASGKLVLLDKLLPKLKEGGHRVLLFSQFKIMLDILEDYLDLRDFKHERVDGSITGKKRQMAIDRFQAKMSMDSSFIMLLSTRAGGVGINLTAADTCVIFDSDWNPQNDLQAQARCHRIGQTKSVKVYRLLSRKTYEMQMFHMSSLKMGLDQAVLQGIENGTSSSGSEGQKHAMTKEEVEKLLRHGAYDVFSEEKAGASEKESNDFIEQDIDSILERRSKTVVHDNTGSQSNAAGGTFSKASFKASSSAVNAKDSMNDNVDVDDPDFWKKMIGESKFEETEDNLGKKRARKKANYNEHQYDEDLDYRLTDGDHERRDDSSSYDDGSGDESDDDIINRKMEIQFTSANESIIQNKKLQQIVNERKVNQQKYERRKWGGKGQASWKRSDINLILKCLPRYGYGNVTWKTFFKTFLSDSAKQYHEAEIKRMCWALCLVVLREAVDDDVNDIARRAERNARKKQEAADKNEPVAPHKQDTSTYTKSEEWKQKQNMLSFKKIWSSHFLWASKALEDGIEFAKLNPPRALAILERNSKERNEGDRACSSLIDAFVENVWPALVSRGWKQVVSPDSRKKKSRKQFSYNGRVYASLVEVLDVAPREHPELTNTVESVISAAALLKSEQKDTQCTIPTMDPSQIDCHSLDLFLAHFAPLQLMVDRRRPDKIPISLRVLHICSFLQNAHSLVARTKETKGEISLSPEDHRKLTRLISVNPKASLPHPLWKPIHDAVLISAIVKHGWIDRESHCRAITEDKEITWGYPFEKVEKAESSDIPVVGGEEVQREVDLVELKAIALRVVEFLNQVHGFLNELKGFNLDLVLKTYGILRRMKDGENVGRWVLNESLLGSKPRNEGSVEDGSDVDQSLNDIEVVDLPTRKALLKRSKTILSKASLVPLSQGHKSILSENEGKKQWDFSVLDQSNVCNIFLAEVLRTIIKTNENKLNLRRLVMIAKKEVDLRFQATHQNKSGKSNSSEALELKHIGEHVTMVNRQPRISANVKNVLRVIMGIDPVTPKKTGDSLFAFDNRQSLQLAPITGKSPRDNKESNANVLVHDTDDKVNQKESATGDAAINRAIGIAKRRGLSRAGHNFSSNSLPIAYAEALLLGVFCSQGMPIFKDGWEILFTTDGSEDNDYSITWLALGAIIEAAAKQWHETAVKNYLHARDTGKRPDEIAEFQVEVEVKKEALIEAMRLHQSPDRLAKKSIMLLEAIRIRSGPTESQKRKTQKKLDYGLGSRPLQWNTKHICNWAKVLDIMQNGRPLANTGAHFMTDQIKVTPAGYLDKKGCRAIFIQVSQQTRLRSLFVKYNSRKINEMLTKASKNSQSSGEIWEAQPSWWARNEKASVQNDRSLLSGMLRYGFGGFDEMMRQSKVFPHSREANDVQSSESFTRKCAQERMNHMTRELSALDDTADSIQRLNERKRSRFHTDFEAPNVESSSKSSSSRIQIGINAFLRPALSKVQNEIIILSDAESPEEGTKRKAMVRMVTQAPEKKLKK